MSPPVFDTRMSAQDRSSIFEITVTTNKVVYKVDVVLFERTNARP